MLDAYSHLLATGSSLGLEEQLMSFDDFTQIIGLEEKYELDEQFKA
jgi:hypothetical protein